MIPASPVRRYTAWAPTTNNHDKPFRGRGSERYEAASFELHHGQASLTLPGDIEVLACHFPYRCDSGSQDRYQDHPPADSGGWLLHGHVHEKWRQRGSIIDVGVDAWSGYPVTDTHLGSLITAGENDLRPLPWYIHSQP